MKEPIDRTELKVWLTRRNMPMWRLASELGISHTTLNRWLDGERPQVYLQRDIERILEVPEGTLAKRG